MLAETVQTTILKIVQQTAKPPLDSSRFFHGGDFLNSENKLDPRPTIVLTRLPYRQGVGNVEDPFTWVDKRGPSCSKRIASRVCAARTLNEVR